MALIKSSVIASASGSVGGTVYSRNRGGMYIRNRSVPVNPNTEDQIRARQDLGQSSTAWRALTQAVRDTWVDYAAATPWFNKLGDAIVLTGQQAFCGCSALAKLLGLSVPATAPAVPGRSGINVTAVTLSVAGDAEVVYSGTNNWTANGGGLALFLGRPVSAGVASYKGPWTYQGPVLGAAVPPASPQVVPCSGLIEGQVRFVRVRGFDSTGRWSSDVIFGPITVAA